MFADRKLNTCRAELRAKQEKRQSAEQERTRRRAAIDLMKKRGGWMAAFYENLEQAMSGVARNVDAAYDDVYDQTPKVLFCPRFFPASPTLCL